MEATDRSSWQSMVEVYVQLWTSTGYFFSERLNNPHLTFKNSSLPQQHQYINKIRLLDNMFLFNLNPSFRLRTIPSSHGEHLCLEFLSTQRKTKDDSVGN